MSNSGKNTNGSQFYITTAESPHLDGKHVVFGKVFKGMGVIKRLQKVFTDDQDRPRTKCTIYNCGELVPGEENGLITHADSKDIYPDYPEDMGIDMTVERIIKISHDIKSSGNALYMQGRSKKAIQKYEKCLRYLNSIPQNITEGNDKIEAMMTACLLNSAACKLRLELFEDTVEQCNQVCYRAENRTALNLNSANIKALYRRGQAHLRLRNYNSSLGDFSHALRYAPNDKAILTAIDDVKKEIQKYKVTETEICRKMFK